MLSNPCFYYDIRNQRNRYDKNDIGYYKKIRENFSDF